jgi:Tfp pilus assembly protein PilX
MRDMRACSDRRGFVVICVLACMLVVLLLGVQMTKRSLSERLRIRDELRLLQTELLAETAIESAQRALSRDRSYRGETWTPELHDNSETKYSVVIEVSPVGDSTTRVLCTATSRTTVHAKDAIQRTRERIIANSTTPKKE